MSQSPDKKPDFFISYTGADAAWAEWIAIELENAGYRTVIQLWDFAPGSNFVVEMHQAFLDLVVAGTGLLLVEEAPLGEASAFRFTAVPITGAVLEEVGRPAPFAASRPLTLSALELAPPGPGELRVRVAAGEFAATPVTKA